MLRTFRLTQIAILALLAMNLLLGAAWARNERVLYSFCPGGYPCTDGAQPAGGIVLDNEGNVYGTAYWGGAYNGGVVFKLTPSGKETVLYSFCSQSGCADGKAPLAGLIFDTEGNLYGTTAAGGNNGSGCEDGYGVGCGVVFKLTPSGEETVLYAFTGSPDGDLPAAGLVFDKEGNLYGTTFYGGGTGCDWGCGVVFKIDVKGEETVLYSFCSETGCADGTNPSAGLVVGSRGNLYGTTVYGGYYNGSVCLHGCGTAFKLTPSGEETVLHAFTGPPDGAIPEAGLVFGKEGNLYGTTLEGGNVGAGGPGFGTVFKVTRSGKERVLYKFCSQHDCTDGDAPGSVLVLDKEGKIYGTTPEGSGTGGYHGVAFKLTLTGRETVLHEFTSESDGSEPNPGLVFDKRGNLYGPTFGGGAYNYGTVFKLTR